MKSRVLIIGATGQVGSHVVQELDVNHEGIIVRLATTQPKVAERWRAEGREAVVFDLNQPSEFTSALEGVDRVFLLTTYTAEMLYQSKMLVDAAKRAGVSHIVQLGVFSSGNDHIPHFTWHELIQTYIKSSGIAWTILHPNVIYGDPLAKEIRETGSFGFAWKDAPQGYVCAGDIGAVAARVLLEGPKKHGGKDYWLSTEVLTGPQIADILSEALGRKISYKYSEPNDLAAQIEKIPSAATRLYMESAVQTMREAVAGNMKFQNVVRDDVLTVLGRPGITFQKWAQQD